LTILLLVVVVAVDLIEVVEEVLVHFIQQH
jgi:hypothetical protein